ncbi:MAG: Biotin synthase [Pelotomaculum sp. PtaB.Bin013]|uniref:Biotin synthase n=1 Tax=Pelotomaculum isophthalicicum JI TaxID=947010 RepID=A0A9X4H1E4_9FIRM|nr:biotin synthase BioB [Pelotomaculum isophthalicicum]MDF9408076.1 biotin synthase BioB [Pelotomaculum isophthalicicum JI]OPX92290.1 MAG: Biotin synthase [Pelotomaculum sp. PtaB.Bin013]
MFDELVEKIKSGGEITFDEALAMGELTGERLNELFLAALLVTRHLHGNRVDLCSIMNVKSGRCSEDCIFCAQSGHYRTDIDVYSLLSEEEILEQALEMEAEGARRFSLVTSGKGILNSDFDKILAIFEILREKTSLNLCASLGIINYDQAVLLKKAGVTRYHHNIETSRSFYAKICTTHLFNERVETIRAAGKAGLEICAGGIIGLGESWRQRVEMAFKLKELHVTSVPVNILTPIKGTPLWGSHVPAPLEVLQTLAMFRMVLPGAVIRLAGGREAALRDLQSTALLAGVNGLMVGNYLTTSGRGIEHDLQMIKDLEIEIWE